MLANHPSIKPYLVEGTDADTDEPLIYDRFFEDGFKCRVRFYHNGETDEDLSTTIGMLFDWTSPDIWSLHMLAKPVARGGDALAFASEAIRKMFFVQGAREIWGTTPIHNERARAMHRKVGGIPRGFMTDPYLGEVELFATPRDEWIAPTT